MKHHEDSIAAYVDRARQDPDILGVIVNGSVARGTERADSDVDLYLMLTETAFATRAGQNRFSYVERESVTYEGGYYDIKIVSPRYLTRAVEQGDEPTRASFLGARVAWSRVDDLEDLVAAIPVIQASVWERRMASFMAQVRLHGGYFLNQAVKLDNSYLLHHAAVHMVGAGGRALLALNHTLFQGNKYLEQTIASLDRVPADYLVQARAVLERPSVDTATDYRELLESFHDWPLPAEDTLSTFVRDNELGWLTGTLPPEYG